jgi:hypothetical protein
VSRQHVRGPANWDAAPPPLFAPLTHACCPPSRTPSAASPTRTATWTCHPGARITCEHTARTARAERTMRSRRRQGRSRPCASASTRALMAGQRIPPLTQRSGSCGSTWQTCECIEESGARLCTRPTRVIQSKQQSRACSLTANFHLQPSPDPHYRTHHDHRKCLGVRPQCCQAAAR